MCMLAWAIFTLLLDSSLCVPIGASLTPNVYHGSTYYIILLSHGMKASLKCCIANIIEAISSATSCYPIIHVSPSNTTTHLLLPGRFWLPSVHSCPSSFTVLPPSVPAFFLPNPQLTSFHHVALFFFFLLLSHLFTPLV